MPESAVSSERRTCEECHSAYADFIMRERALCARCFVSIYYPQDLAATEEAEARRRAGAAA